MLQLNPSRRVGVAATSGAITLIGLIVLDARSPAEFVAAGTVAFIATPLIWHARPIQRFISRAVALIVA